MITCAGISTSSVYPGANDYVLNSRFPLWSSSTIRGKYLVSQL